MTAPKREVEIGRAVKPWLEGRGLEVFQEVALGSRVDLVGRDAARVVCVEAKLHANFSVIAQAERWIAQSSESWIAVPLGRNVRLAEIVCRELGIGILVTRPRARRGGSRDRPSLRPARSSDLGALGNAEPEPHAAVRIEGKGTRAKLWPMEAGIF